MNADNDLLIPRSITLVGSRLVLSGGQGPEVCGGGVGRGGGVGGDWGRSWER